MTVEPTPPVINTESTTDPLTVDLHYRRIPGYPVTNSELEMLASGGESINAGFLGTSIGAAISFISTLITTDLSDRVFAVYVALSVASAVGIILFMIRTVTERARVKKLLKEIRENPDRLRTG